MKGSTLERGVCIQYRSHCGVVIENQTVAGWTAPPFLAVLHTCDPKYVLRSWKVPSDEAVWKWGDECWKPVSFHRQRWTGGRAELWWSSCSLARSAFFIKGIVHLKELGFQLESPFQQPTEVFTFAEHPFLMRDTMWWRLNPSACQQQLLGTGTSWQSGPAPTRPGAPHLSAPQAGPSSRLIGSAHLCFELRFWIICKSKGHCLVLVFFPQCTLST